MLNPLEPIIELNALALRSFSSPYLYAVDQWFFDCNHLVYDIGVKAWPSEARLVLVYQSNAPLPLVDVLEVSGHGKLLNRADPASIIRDWIFFGWRYGPKEISTIVRTILWTGKALEALYAETIIAGQDSHRRQIAPQGLMALHNTRKKNWQSICQYGLSLGYARSESGVWVRPPSYGKISRSRFTGELSFFVNISGLLLLRCNGYEIVVGESIPLSRLQRIFDLDRKEDA